MYIAVNTTYSNYNKHISEASTNTETIRNHKNKGWFHFIRNYLLTLIKSMDALLSDYRTLVIGNRDSPDAKLRPSVSQLVLYDAITLAKAAWSSHQAEKIHFM